MICRLIVRSDNSEINFISKNDKEIISDCVYLYEKDNKNYVYIESLKSIEELIKYYSISFRVRNNECVLSLTPWFVV